MSRSRLGLILSALFLCSNAEATRFRNAYISFELPPSWACKLEGSEYVCESTFAQKTKEAIIILTAKEAGPEDNLPAYLRYLNTPKMLSNRSGSVKSQVINVKERMLNKQMWIDGLHLGSETGAYFTRYLATVQNRISIVVTFSAHKQHYTKYSNEFIRAVDSLEVVATADTLGKRIDTTQPGQFGVRSTDMPGPSIDMPPDTPPWEQQPKAKKYSFLLWLAAMLMVIGVLLYLRAGKKKPEPKKKDKPKDKDTDKPKDPEKK